MTFLVNNNLPELRFGVNNKYNGSVCSQCYNIASILK